MQLEAVIWSAQTGEPLLETAAFYRCLLDDGYLEKVEVVTLRTHPMSLTGLSVVDSRLWLNLGGGRWTKRKALKPIAEMLLER